MYRYATLADKDVLKSSNHFIQQECIKANLITLPDLQEEDLIADINNGISVTTYENNNFSFKYVLKSKGNDFNE